MDGPCMHTTFLPLFYLPVTFLPVFLKQAAKLHLAFWDDTYQSPWASACLVHLTYLPQ